MVVSYQFCAGGLFQKDFSHEGSLCVLKGFVQCLWTQSVVGVLESWVLPIQMLREKKNSVRDLLKSCSTQRILNGKEGCFKSKVSHSALRHPLSSYVFSA